MTKPAKCGHYVCERCHQYIRPEKGEQAIKSQTKVERGPHGNVTTYSTKRHSDPKICERNLRLFGASKPKLEVDNMVRKDKGAEATTEAEPTTTEKAPTKAKQPKPVDFPVEGKINKYGFIGVPTKVLEAAGISQKRGKEGGEEVLVEFTVENGRLVVRSKASGA